MSLYNDIISKQTSLAVIGLGYVGLPIAAAFSQKVNVIGFDVNIAKIINYKNGIDPTSELGHEALCHCRIHFSADETELQKAKFFIIAVPTPINSDKTPDFQPIINASTILGRNLSKGSIVVYESTVYPGVTETLCLPILEKESGLQCGVDFKIGYSPERINPGDLEHRLDNIKKIVSGMDENSLEEIAKIYSLVIKAGVHRASSIKIAEAAKIAENSQRDINIAFMNELAMVFDKMDIDTNEVLDAMNTKWNALKFSPGLVGGHCIGVDPYYFIYEAENLGYHSQIILAGRKVNDGMGEFIAEAAIKQLVLAGKMVRDAKVAIFGITFKENFLDVRNSKVMDIIKSLREYGISPIVTDPFADQRDVLQEYKISLTPIEEIKNLDCIIMAVAHEQFKQLTIDAFDLFYKKMPNQEKVIIDIKGICPSKQLKDKNYRYWRL